MHRPAATSRAAEMTVRSGSRGHFSLPSLRGGGLVGPERVITSSQWPEFWHLALSQERRGTSLAAWWLRLCASTTRGPGSIPGWRTKIPQATRQKKKEREKARLYHQVAQEEKSPLVIFCGCSAVQSCPTLQTFRTVACQATLSVGFFSQEYWSGLPFPSPGNLPNPGTEPASPELAGRIFIAEPLGKSHFKCIQKKVVDNIPILGCIRLI